MSSTKYIKIHIKISKITIINKLLNKNNNNKINKTKIKLIKKIQIMKMKNN